jgi:cellulose synthase (UDP-forming)
VTDAGESRTRHALWLAALRVLVAANLLLGAWYLGWRYLNTINWAMWPLALALLAAETYSYGGAWLFGLTIWRIRRRVPPPVRPGATVDVFITCYNEPPELVRETARAAVAIRYPHRTYVLDDGDSPEMRAMAAAVGAEYLVRGDEWRGHARHAKAGNLNNALLQTAGEFVLVLDADQIPAPGILDRALGYFDDPRVAFVQTPQWFYNVPPGDPFGSQATLFYGPIQQGKDGWNAAFFCGSNAILRREALMQLGVATYVRDLERRVGRALGAADRILRDAARRLSPTAPARVRAALEELRAAVREATAARRAGASLDEVTWAFQRRAAAVARRLVRDDLLGIQAELAAVPGLDPSDLEGSLAGALEDEAALEALTVREASPLAAIETVRALLLAVDVHRADEAQPVMPLAVISVTEDMATAMRLHARGWRSVYHDEILARGLAPEDLRTALQQRLRWAQGTLQVMLRESPLTLPGLSPGQRLMYLATIWTYLSGFATVVYLAAPLLFLVFGWLPIRAFSADFFWHLLPYLAVNQLLFLVVGWGRRPWRGQQYSLALFPLWITAVLSAVGNVYFGRPLAFVVTPKTRQAGQRRLQQLRLVWPQVLTMVLLLAAGGWKLVLLATGRADDVPAAAANVFWAGYDVLQLSVVLRAVAYRPALAPEALEVDAAAHPPAVPRPVGAEAH